MSSYFLKDNRTRHLAGERIGKANRLIEQNAEQYESNVFSENLKTCVNRLNAIIEKLEQTNNGLSVIIEGQEATQEVEWNSLSMMTGHSLPELVDIQESFQDQNLPSENWSFIRVTGDRSNKKIQMTAQMQQVLIGQQQIQQ